ncbi:hypothetical protein P3T21_007713 [Paraburkholderia sp. GAS334]|jgi:hypothetical protein
MVDMSKLKRRSLPPPPAPDEASPNLKAPEHAPAAHTLLTKRIDGRSARRSNRTVQFATRVTAEFDDRIRAIAARDGLLLVEVMERALEAYESSR